MNDPNAVRQVSIPAVALVAAFLLSVILWLGLLAVLAWKVVS